ncbi:hypothetical protein SUGI_0898880 [Cryptomeria japonica]|uniref:uncharacterized protein LOC131062801 n=1 Tax=Cryptomeria japonica TaxID=3369 RepID=UPI0024146D32|nr:uncharacterized protein LOC131062801 [Cryptomeria japonica]GLJ43287.1 hypothetical protein SUGI_0898880 [Cryptomeria japonica]
MMTMSEVRCAAPFGMTETDNLAKEDGNFVRVKFLCSFGGSILPRPSDGKLRYAGGETRIVCVSRDVNYRELMAKLRELYEQETLSLKYQQPDDDLDALVSVLSDEDVCHMMEEYDRLEASDGVCSRLRLFLFAAADQQQQQNLMSIEGNDERDCEQRYVEALNSVVEMNRQQFENNYISISNSNNSYNRSNRNNENVNSSSSSSNNNNNNNSLVAGNGSEAGIAQHVSVALPVSLMKPFSKGGGSATSSPPPSSPSHHHPHHHKPVSAADQYYQKQTPHQHNHYVHSSNLVQHDQYSDMQGQSHQYLSYSEVQGHEYLPMGQAEFNRNNQYVNHHHMALNESFQNIQGPELSPRGQPELSGHHHHHHHYHHHEHVPQRNETYREVTAVSAVEIPSKGQIGIDGHRLHLSHRVESCPEIPVASVAEIPFKGQSEVGSYHQHLPHPHENKQDVGVEIPFQLQPDVGYHQQHLSHLQSDSGSHPQHVLTNIATPLRETIGLPGVESPLKGQSNIGSGLHSGFVNGRDYKQIMADTYVPHVESQDNLHQSEQHHINVKSEVAASNPSMLDRERIYNIPSHQSDLHSPTYSWQHEMPLAYHQAAQNISDEIYHDQEHNSSKHHYEVGWSDSVQRGAFLHPIGRRSEQLQHLQNDNTLHQVAFNSYDYVYRDHHEIVHSNLLQNNAFSRSMVGQVEKQILQNDIEMERPWNPSYYTSGPQLSHDFSHISHPSNVLDFHLASASTVPEANSSNHHERYLQNHHNSQVPWACDEYGNPVEYISNQPMGNLAPLDSLPSSNRYIPGENHVTWHRQPYFVEKDARFPGQNLSHQQKAFEGNSSSQQQYAVVQSRQNISEVWVPHSYSEQSLLYPGQNGLDKDLNKRVDQSMYSTQQPDQLVTFQEGQEKVKERVMHPVNDQVEMLMDGKANGVYELEESMHDSIEQSNLWDHYPRGYYGLHPDDAYNITEVEDFHKQVISDQYETQIDKAPPAVSVAVHGKFVDMHGKDNVVQDVRAPDSGNVSQNKLSYTVIESHLNDSFRIDVQPNNGQGIGFYNDGKDESADPVLGKRYNQDIERMGHVYISHGMNTSNVTNFPDGKRSDVTVKISNISDSSSNHLIESHATSEIEDLKFLAREPVKRHASFQCETDITCVSNVLETSEDSQILSSSDFSHAINSPVAFVHDQPALSRSSAIFPSASSSSPQRIIDLASTTPPIYDQSPANSTNVALPENLLSETEEGRKSSELDKNIILGNIRMMSIKAQLEMEHNLKDPELPKQDEDADNRMNENCMNIEKKADCLIISRPMDLPLHSPSIPHSKVSSASKILDKQHSVGNEKEAITEVDYKEVKDEDMFPTSDVEENIPKQEVTENNSLELVKGGDSDSADMARKASAEAEAQALAKGLQIIKNSDLEEIRELGSGTYGTVYYGKWKGSDVAIKRIKASCFEGRPSEQERLIADFWKEASILGQLHHPNVISFYGVVRDGPGATLATVTEYMVNGSLKQVLRKKDRTIDRRKRLILAMDAAFGMEYLHEKNIVHFDLKCENLLVNMRDPHRPVCKIGDMGLSKVKHQTLVSGGVRGTLPWMAPELLSGRSGVSDKIDVYSFGIVMWELLTGDEPYANMHCGSIIGGIMKNTLRPPVPDWCEPAWRSLMERCWSANPVERPPFSDISRELRAVAASMNLK